MNVTLPWSECLLAAQVGSMRRIYALRNGIDGAFSGGPAEPWDADIEGAAAELAVCKLIGCFWTGMEVSGSDRKEGVTPDAGGVQVRSTRLKSGSLILHEGDADDSAFVLVVGRIPRLDVKGWIHGRDGKRADYWRSESVRHPAYFVPADALSQDFTVFERASTTSVGA
jgi:hypothetical protein